MCHMHCSGFWKLILVCLLVKNGWHFVRDNFFLVSFFPLRLCHLIAHMMFCVVMYETMCNIDDQINKMSTSVLHTET